jgi:hypothetical protein
MYDKRIWLRGKYTGGIINRLWKIDIRFNRPVNHLVEYKRIWRRPKDSKAFEAILMVMTWISYTFQIYLQKN